MYIRRRNENQDQHPSYERVARTLSEFRCASVRFHGTLIRSMEEEKWKREQRDKERGKRKEKRDEQIDHRKMGGI